VFASPIYFNSIPGPLKNIIDRCQLYWASRKRKDKEKIKSKKAELLLCGGAPAYKRQFTAAEIVLKGVLKDLNTEIIGKIYISNTDKAAIINREEISNKIKKLADKTNNIFY
jgi:multimeric flavodoxin WrbA